MNCGPIAYVYYITLGIVSSCLHCQKTAPFLPAETSAVVPSLLGETLGQDMRQGPEAYAPLHTRPKLCAMHDSLPDTVS